MIKEPDLLEDHVVILVRHTTGGIVYRLFLVEHAINVVHDWIESIHKLPMFFNVINFKGDILKPFDVKSDLNTAECDNPPTLEEDKEITMSGFSVSEYIPVYDTGNEKTQHFLTQLMDQELERTPNAAVVLSLKCFCDTESVIKMYISAFVYTYLYGPSRSILFRFILSIVYLEICMRSTS